MLRKLRLLAFALPATFLALTSAQGLPAPLGTCRLVCVGSGGFTPMTYTATREECCSLNPNPCPAGSTPRSPSWNSARCI